MNHKSNLFCGTRAIWNEVFIGQRFNLGQVVSTRGAAARMHELKVNPADLLVRHARGDWGDVCEDDKKTNGYNCLRNGMVLSCYGENDKRIWVITDAGHAVTTLLLPEEY